jgi:hypothetical protein
MLATRADARARVICGVPTWDTLGADGKLRLAKLTGNSQLAQPSQVDLTLTRAQIAAYIEKGKKIEEAVAAAKAEAGAGGSGSAEPVVQGVLTEQQSNGPTLTPASSKRSAPPPTTHTQLAPALRGASEPAVGAPAVDAPQEMSTAPRGMPLPMSASVLGFCTPPAAPACHALAWSGSTWTSDDGTQVGVIFTACSHTTVAVALSTNYKSLSLDIKYNFDQLSFAPRSAEQQYVGRSSPAAYDGLGSRMVSVSVDLDGHAADPSQPPDYSFPPTGQMGFIIISYRVLKVAPVRLAMAATANSCGQGFGSGSHAGCD